MSTKSPTLSHFTITKDNNDGHFKPLYIGKKGVHNLQTNEYKYRCVDKSIIANLVMQPFWNYCATFLPVWMAPNLVTLLGFFFIVLSFFVSLWYNPTFTEPMPSWVYLLNAVCLFLYQLFDALDGKQARRTGTSSPLGELFDHGCDAMTSVFSAVTVYASVRSGLGWFPLINLAIMMSTFYCAQWEVYFTGALHLWYINVTEAQFFGIFTHLLAFLFGANWWVSTIRVGAFVFSYHNFLVFGSASGTLILLLINLKNIFLTPPKEQEGGYPKAFLYLLPNIWIGATVFFLAYLTQNVWLFDATSALALHVGMGFIYANAISKLCTARVCSLQYDIRQILFAVPLFCSILLFAGVSAKVLLCITWALAVISYGAFSYGLIHDLTHALDIYAFYIKQKQQE